MKQNLFIDAALPLEKNYLIESHKERNVLVKHYYVKEEFDYKLKHTSDKAYLKQLSGYKEYIKMLTNKEVKTYLYSILDEKLEELEV